MKSLKRNNTQFVVLVVIIAALLLFQNCSKQLVSQCTGPLCQDWRSVDTENQLTAELQKIAFYDEKQYEVLTTNSSHDLVYQPGAPAAGRFFGDEFAAVVHLPVGYQGSVFNIHSENVKAESSWLSIDAGHVIVGHSTTSGSYYKLKIPIPNPEKQIVVGVYFGVRVQDIRVVLNGILMDAEKNNIIAELVGSPVNFSYIEKNLAVNSASPETFVFKRKLSTYELASMSRHIDKLKGLNVVAYDDSIKVDSDIDFIQERPQFIAARNVLKSNHCFKCHGSWVNYGEYNFVSSELVAPNNMGNSSLWTRLAGTLELNKQNKKKDMPLKEKPLQDEELDTVKAWIRSIDPMATSLQQDLQQ